MLYNTKFVVTIKISTWFIINFTSFSELNWEEKFLQFCGSLPQ